MPKYKLVVTTEDGKSETTFDAADKKSAEEYGTQLARFGGFDPDVAGVKVEIKAARGG